MAIKFFKVTSLPAQLEPNGLYFVQGAAGNLMDVYMATSTGMAGFKVLGSAELSAAIADYDAGGAAKLAAAFELALAGDVGGSVQIDGSGNVSLTATLATVEGAAGTYQTVTVDGKGRVTGGRDLTAADLPQELTSNTSGNAATATLAAEASKVTNALTINGEEFDGSATKAFTLIAASEKAAVNGVATLDEAGKVPAAQLPSYVDDVLEADSFAELPVAGERDKIYVTIDDGSVYRWTGSTYIKISDSVSTSDTADTLATARNIGVTGDATGQASFNGSADAVFAITLKDTGTAGEQDAIVTTDAAGRVVSSRALELTDLPAGIISTGIDFAAPAQW